MPTNTLLPVLLLFTFCFTSPQLTPAWAGFRQKRPFGNNCSMFLVTACGLDVSLVL